MKAVYSTKCNELIVNDILKKQKENKILKLRECYLFWCPNYNQ